MNLFRKAFSNVTLLRGSLRGLKSANCVVSSRMYSEESQRPQLEKSINHVTLMGRVGINPQLRGTEAKPVVVFTLATNTNYKYDTGEVQQKTEWHRIAVFKPNLRDIVLDHLKKGTRVYVDGRLLYGEFTDEKGMLHTTASIVANDVIFLGSTFKKEIPEEISEKIN